MEELDAVLTEAARDSGVRVLILTGAGDKAFVAGADINELAQQTPLGGRETALFGQGVFRKLETLGKPSIAAINGFALGGGCELALACSIRLASRTRETRPAGSEAWASFPATAARSGWRGCAAREWRTSCA